VVRGRLCHILSFVVGKFFLALRTRFLPIPHLRLTLPLGGFPSEYRNPVWYEKTRMVWLPNGEKNSKISLFFLAQLTNVADRRTPHDGNSRAYA